MKGVVDMTPAVNEVINTGIKNEVVDSKELKIKYHTVRQLYTRSRVFFLLVAALAPELTFISFRHYDENKDPIENFNDDFIVGVYTPYGPSTFHFKYEYLSEFKDVRHIDNAPLYDGYTEEESMERLVKLSKMLFDGKTVNEIVEMINNNESLHESQKPKYLKR